MALRTALAVTAAVTVVDSVFVADRAIEGEMATVAVTLSVFVAATEHEPEMVQVIPRT